MSYSAEQLAEATRLGAATLHEAAGRIGALPSAIKPVAPDMRIAGPAFTVHIPAGDNLWIHRALYAAAPGDVLVVSTSGGIEWGYWGDILNTAAIAQRLGGLVIDGGVRDSAGLATMPFPVFSNGLCINGTIKGFEATAWVRQPIRIGEVVVRQGDLIVGDRDGVVALPEAKVADALAGGARREQDESDKIARIKAGERTIDIYGFGAG
ncbi:4-hydroxy-4-methyl-2-oxoglutarate aldolase [Sphingomonas vulcanisoli]|uniref:Putative 4-hydroxy-4-methyl-2-oxoglutarate aldolase n=1 Tax=Sphingomonas vulcanisoli TaxID=1658060 RepID=A0ABX0TQC7_9SPHN|nr:4-hydroxy-4-methyl-2-oxoglutarate aldolase [Sphingomonas vulcanisoli]NIJ07293.1 4-hydroxy-4-methyl-2-oxoglutarate aldolase [Sphingomonas vulcanisoli]